MTAPGTPNGLPPKNEALEAKRKNGVKAIKAAQRQLHLDDGTYREMLKAQTGKTSAADLTLREQGKVLDHLRRCGATSPKAQARSGGRTRLAPVPDRAAQVAQVHHWLGELERITGEVHTLNYADAICKKNGWAERMDFCSPRDLHQLVGALARTARWKAAKAGKTAVAPAVALATTGA
jgi:hypothetical protein